MLGPLRFPSGHTLAMNDVWTFTEDPPACVSATADLWHWSTNYEGGRGPFALFLDLIGWSEDALGEALFDLHDHSLGYLELDKLGKALVEYSDRPTDVRGWVQELMAHEGA